MESARPPVFLVGAPRSGTSPLYRLLCLHPDSAWVSNWVRRTPHLPAVASLNRLAGRMRRLRRSVWFGEAAEAAAPDRQRTLLERLFPQPVEGEPLFAAYDIPESSDATDATRRQTSLRRAVEEIVRFGGGRVFVSKRTAHNRRLPLLHAVFPDARVVAVTRDGRAVAESLNRAGWWPESTVWWYGDTPLTWEERGRDPWELCATHWVREVEALERGLAAMPPAQVLSVRYEDLVADEAATLARIGEFAGLPDGRQWRRALAAVRRPHDDDGWRDRLGDAVEKVESIQAGWLRKYGYLD
ncbi:MAG TPA: sulfotransferase [Streptosporangiales bacterium]